MQLYGGLHLSHKNMQNFMSCYSYGCRAGTKFVEEKKKNYVIIAENIHVLKITTHSCKVGFIFYIHHIFTAVISTAYILSSYFILKVFLFFLCISPALI